MAEHTMKDQSDKMMVEYQTQYGDRLKLTLSMVKNYLVSGNKDLVTTQEMVFFMHTCKARKLNPFLKDCYLVKYTSHDPAAIITSRDYFCKNARKAKDCAGWNNGITIQNKDGNLEYREGTIILDGEKLLGGWAKAKPSGWAEPKFWTVPLQRYIRYKKDGTISKFWTEDKQSEMIAKVAEVQLLRELWGEESTGMYSPEEMPSLENVDFEISEKGMKEVIDITPPADPKDAINKKLNELKSRGQTEPEKPEEETEADPVTKISKTQDPMKFKGWVLENIEDIKTWDRKRILDVQAKWSRLELPLEDWPIGNKKPETSNGDIIWCNDRKQRIPVKICETKCDQYAFCSDYEEYAKKTEKEAKDIPEEAILCPMDNNNPKLPHECEACDEKCGRYHDKVKEMKG